MRLFKSSLVYLGGYCSWHGLDYHDGGWTDKGVINNRGLQRKSWEVLDMDWMWKKLLKKNPHLEMREWNRLEIGKLQTEGATLGKKK